MTAIERLRARTVTGSGLQPLRILAASGQVGYGIPELAFNTGLARDPHMIGADMGSTDPGPYYLGSGRMAQSEMMTRLDLAKILAGARRLNVPLLIGTAGTAGAAPHLDATLDLVREVSRDLGLHFRLVSIAADIPRELIKTAIRAGAVEPLGEISPLDEREVDGAAHIVGQMGMEAFARALEAGADVVIAGRACDTAIFATIPMMLGYPVGLAMHMARIVECTSLCCVPGGRDAVLATLDEDGFIIDSMNPARHATPMSVAAHSLYEQADPNVVFEPEGALYIGDACYEAVDEHRTRVTGSRWQPSAQLTVKIEGAARVGERAVLLCGSADPRVIAGVRQILQDVEKNVRAVMPDSTPYQVIWRVYGIDGVFPWPELPDPLPREVFIMGEFIADSADHAKAISTVAKQYLLHHGFPGRLSTSGNIAFPFTPPEVSAGTAYRFNIYHVMQTQALEPLFPLRIDDI